MIKGTLAALAVTAILIVLTLMVAPCVHAEEVKTTIVFRNDFVFPEKGDDFVKQWTTFQWNIGKFTLGTDIFTRAQTDYLGVRPYAAVNIFENFDVMTGYQTDSKGAVFVPAGFWYYPTFGKVKTFLDAREYVSVSRTAKDFMEIFLGLTYPVAEKTSIGLEIVYDRYWQKKADEYTVGICVSHKLTPNLALFVRPTKDWYTPGKNSSTVTGSVRVGARLSF